MNKLPSASLIDSDLLKAYRETNYRVACAMPLCLCVGRQNPGLDQLLKRRGDTTCAFITACNPYSRILSDEENQQRQYVLANVLRELGLGFLDGVGVHPCDPWPGEPSYLVFGLSMQQARVLAESHEQNAFLWCELNGVPELILLR